MHDINGMIRIRNESFSFNEVTGTNSSGQAVCNGIWSEKDGLQLRFLCNSVALDDRLRNALTPNIRDVWDSFQPSGTVSVGRVMLNLLPGQEFVDVRVDADLAGTSAVANSNVSIKPVWFPYRLNQLTGQVEIGDGKVAVKNIRGKHGRTWITCRGTGNYSAFDWAVKLQDLLVGSLVADDDLLNALPRSLQESVRELNFKGQLNLQGEITLAGQHSNPPIANNQSATDVQQASFVSPVPTGASATTMGWNLRLDMEQAMLQLGWPLNSVFGSVELVGRYDGMNTQCLET